MIKKTAIILTTIAIVFTIVSLVLDFSSVGERWDDFGKNVDWWLLALVILITAGFGMLLGLFLFRKVSYRQRIGVTIPIAFILINLYSFYQITDYYFGLSEDCNYFTAKKDLEKGKVEIFVAGQLISRDSERAQIAKDSVMKAFGFTLVNVGIHSKGLEWHNKAIEDYLLERNGENWQERMYAKFDSIDRADNK